ncbi:Oidioi.mRNA.OKI2018_I69.XSR.g16886.t1.cds [Oikopleura dioica]|uniref:Oidioi.mRNA.OKI2018_I69.XSR.g16886.t1.cds n=1 Tax=Oikopleura dioica TaxID=34765 RepID=A0ABN7SM87_OIKDI|nr:Oidioi.mRNA.OKI2018_I69.XSR.g16886.t1.cds [Oikopleura dioica]
MEKEKKKKRRTVKQVRIDRLNRRGPGGLFDQPNTDDSMMDQTGDSRWSDLSSGTLPEPSSGQSQGFKKDLQIDEIVAIEKNPEDEEENLEKGLFARFLVFITQVVIIVGFPIFIWSCFKIVQEYERAVIFRLGQLKQRKAVGPGIIWINFFTDTLIKIDGRTVCFEIPSQEILTKDSVTIRVDAVVYYRKVEPTRSVCEVENSDHSTRLLAQVTLLNTLRTRTLTEVLSEGESISDEIQQALTSATDPWGICVERVELKDVVLPAQMQRAMAADAEATREAKAKIIQLTIHSR